MSNSSFQKIHVKHKDTKQLKVKKIKTEEGNSNKSRIIVVTWISEKTL